MMGPFILGVLVGWLAEWLFFTFWVKAGTGGNSSDCSALRAELDAKNKEIAALKASTSTTTSKATSVSSAATSAATSTAAKKAPVKKATTSAKKSVAKKTTAKKPATKTSAPKKAVAKKPAAKKAAPAKTAPAKKATTAQKSAPTKKAAPVKKSVSKITGDDLTKLSGIGPSMAATLGELGITSYKNLAAMDDDILRDMLEASGARLNNNKEAMDSWNEQALLADKGDFSGLKKLQEALKK